MHEICSSLLNIAGLSFRKVVWALGTLIQNHLKMPYTIKATKQINAGPLQNLNPCTPKLASPSPPHLARPHMQDQKHTQQH